MCLAADRPQLAMTIVFHQVLPQEGDTEKPRHPNWLLIVEFELARALCSAPPPLGLAIATHLGSGYRCNDGTHWVIQRSEICLCI